MNEWLGANAIANCWSRIAQELPSRGRFRRELNLAQNAVLSRHAIGKGPAGTTETLETWSWVRGDLGGLSPVNFSRPYGTSRRSNLYPGLRPITLTCLADNRSPRRGFFFVSNSPQKRHPERRAYGTQSWQCSAWRGPNSKMRPQLSRYSTPTTNPGAGYTAEDCGQRQESLHVE
jgi:hypothetical protein